MRTKWTRFAGLCALLTLALPGVSALVGHDELGLGSSEAGLRQHALELDFLSIVCLIFVLLYLRLQRPAVHVPVPVKAGYVTARPAPPALSVRGRLHLSRGPPA